MDHWYKIWEYLDQAASFSFDMEEAFPDAKIISLGQSPAWIVHGVGMLRKLRREQANVVYIAFTGNFFTKDKSYIGCSNAMMFDADEKKYPDQERLQRYIEYSESYGYTPRQLLDLANDGEEIVLTEMINTGTGLAFFLSAWTSQEEPAVIKEFSEAIHFCVYDTNPNANEDNLIFSNPDGSTYSFSLDRMPLSFEQGEIMQNTSSLNECSCGSSRLVPIYRLSADSENIGLDICPNAPVVKEIRGVLYKEIEKRERLLRRMPAEELSL